MSDAPLPGWYPDPEIPGMLRYWTGNEWSEERQGAVEETLPPPAGASTSAPPAPVRPQPAAQPSPPAQENSPPATTSRPQIARPTIHRAPEADLVFPPAAVDFSPASPAVVAAPEPAAPPTAAYPAPPASSFHPPGSPGGLPQGQVGGGMLGAAKTTGPSTTPLGTFDATKYLDPADEPRRPKAETSESANTLPTLQEVTARTFADTTPMASPDDLPEYRPVPPGQADEAADEAAEEPALGSAPPTVRTGMRPEGGVIRDAGLFDDVTGSDTFLWVFGLLAILTSFVGGERLAEANATIALPSLGFALVVAGAFLVLPALLRRFLRNRAAHNLLGSKAVPGWNADPARASTQRYSDGTWTRYVRPLPRKRARPITLVVLLCLVASIAGNLLPGGMGGRNIAISDPAAASVNSYLEDRWAQYTPEQQALACQQYQASPDTAITERASVLYSEMQSGTNTLTQLSGLGVGDLQAGVAYLYTIKCPGGDGAVVAP